MHISRIIGALALVLAFGPVQAAQESFGIPLGRHRAHPTRILARYKDPAGAVSTQNASLLSSLGLTISLRYGLTPGLVAIDVPASALQPSAVISPPAPELQARLLVERIGALRRSGLFRYVEPDYVKVPLRDPVDSAYLDGTLWGLRNIGDQGGALGADISAREAWDLTTGSSNVVVAVIDTGTRYTHQELRTQMWRNPNEIPNNGIDDDGNGIIDDVHGINALDPNAIIGDPMDIDDHGTHVSGTIGAAANGGGPHVGVSWHVQIMACKFLGGLGGTTAGGIACIEYATTNGAVIMNNSWGGGPFEPALFDAIVAAQQAGILFVAAAGNDGTDNDEFPAYPASYDVDNIVSVAALDRADRLAIFSNYGEFSVDLGAPGVEIFSSFAISDSSYETIQGTSMASPHVTGVAALVRAYYPGISVFELRERLLQTVVPVNAMTAISTTGGRVNAYKALSAVGNGELELSITPPSESVLLAGSTQQVFAVVTDLLGVSDATVRGTWVLGTNGTVNFENTGTAPDRVAGDATYSGQFVVANVRELELQVVATAPGKVAATNLVRWHVAELPTNDNFVDAAKIERSGEVRFSNSRFATFEIPDEPLHAGVPTVDATLWWSWSPEFDNRAIIDTAGSDFDTVVAVYTNQPLAQVREVASANDPGGKRQAYVEFDAKAGVTYYIVVGGATVNESGGIRLRVEPNGLPDTLGPIVAFTFPADGSVVDSERVAVTGTATDPAPGSGVSQVVVRLSTDPLGKVAKGTTNWAANVFLRPGANIISAVGRDFALNTGIPVEINVEYMPPTAPNDHFVHATILSGVTGTVAANNPTATREYLEPLHGGNQGGHSIWFRWTAPGNGVLTVATTNVTYDTLLGVYTGSNVTNLTTVAGNDDVIPGNRASKVSLGVNGGTTYSIAVDGYAGSTGTGSLTYEFVPGALFNLSVSADANGRVSTVSGQYAVGTAVTVVAYPNPGYVFDRWTGTVSSTSNPLVLTMNQNHSVTANFRNPSFTDDFETGDFSAQLNYVFDAANSEWPWFVQSESSAGGQYAARTGDIDANQRSVLSLSQNMAAGVASFSYRVSSEENFDVVEFRVNDDVKATWSGLTDWTTYQLVVPSGTNTFEWRFSKDSTLDDGEDAFFLDNLTIPLALATQPSSIRLQMVTELGGLKLRLQGTSGLSYQIETSNDLEHWSPVSTVTAQEGVIEIPTSFQPSQAAKFYRARQL